MRWSSLDTAFLVVLDSTTGVSLAKKVGAPRLQARAGTLFSNPQTVNVLAKPDLILAGGPTRDMVQLTPDSTETLDSLSIPLEVDVLASGGVAGGRRVVYTVSIFPATGPVLTLVPNDTVLTVARVDTATASMRVRLRPGARPDSVVVQASMRRLDNTLVPSPVTFVVEFGP